MGWWDIISKMKLVDVILRGKQLGVVNIRIENKTFNYNFSVDNPEKFQELAKLVADPDFQKKAKEKGAKHLTSTMPDPELLSLPTAEEIAAWAVGDSIFGELKMKGEVQGKLSLKSDDENKE